MSESHPAYVLQLAFDEMISCHSLSDVLRVGVLREKDHDMKTPEYCARLGHVVEREVLWIPAKAPVCGSHSRSCPYLLLVLSIPFVRDTPE
jgi:hypothetical protein